MKQVQGLVALQSCLQESRLLPSDMGLILLLITLLARLFVLPKGGPQELSLFSDDFYYYSKIAGNIAHGYGSTFNGITKTNGYHPLWLLVITFVTKLVGPLQRVIWTVELIITASVVSVYIVTKRTLLLFTCTGWIASILSLFTSLLCLVSDQGGMEIVLTIPLAMTFLYLVLRSTSRSSSRQVFLKSVVGSAVILSRLDSILLVALVGVALLSDEAIRKRLNVEYGLAVFLGFSPFLFYLVFNAIYFSSILPISGSAKQIRFSYSFSGTAMHSIAEYFSVPRQALPFALCLLSLVWLLCLEKGGAARKKKVLVASLVFPLVQMATVSELSDWALWPWYFYSSLVPVGIACGVLLGDSSCSSRRFAPLRWLACGLVALSCGNTMFAMVESSVRSRSVVAVANRVEVANFISVFADAHPGRYAMGDRSGIVGQVIREPIIQTEGLVMDKDFLAHVRRRENLLQVLRAYGVRYYIASIRPGVRYEPCLNVTEPAQAGPTAPHMRSEICALPAATHIDRDYVTLIYDLRNSD